MTRIVLTLILFAAAFTANAQNPIKIKQTQKIPISASTQWAHPRFSPTGLTIYFTDLNGNGIWEYTLRNRSTRRIAADRQSGLAFNVSRDGKSLVYRRTTGIGRTRKQEIVMMNLARRTSSVLASGSDVSIPTFSANTPVYTVRSKTTGLATSTSRAVVSILGIENTKIALSIGGKKVLLDPYMNGSYIWPALSLDNNRLVAYEMDRGTFVCDLDGTNIIPLGRRNAPSWARSGNWIIYMDDRDDGHRLLSSDLWAISPDGRTPVQLTMTRQVFELNPHCSPTENKIVCNTSAGSLLILEYEERQ